MTVWVDGDSCHRKAMKQLLDRGRRIRLVVLADRSIPGVSDSGAEMKVVGHGSGTVDDLIVEQSRAGDLAVTRDLELARRLLDKGLRVLNDRGREWTPPALERRIQEASLMQAMKAGGLAAARVPSYGSDEERAFGKALTRVLEH